VPGASEEAEYEVELVVQLCPALDRIWYESTAEPLLVGDAQFKVTEPAPLTEADGAEGADGTVANETDEENALQSEVPTVPSELCPTPVNARI
jgi:hypothetical protein